MKCNETQGKWCKNKHGASKIIDTFETYQLSLSTIGNGVLTIIHTKMKQVFEREIGTLVLFYKAWHSSPPFSFHKPWLTDSIRCPPTFTYHGGAYFSFFFLEFNNMQDKKSDHYVPMS
jgi:hypothetical protein